MAVSPSVRDELVNRHGVGAYARFRIIPSGRPGILDPETPDLRPDLGLEKRFVIGMVGRMVPVKGYATLLDALPEVFEALPEARVLLAGDGPLREEIRRRTTRNPLKDRVILAGTVKDMDRFYATLNLLAAPSVKEGLSTAALEAGLAGVPLAVSDIPGMRDLVRDRTEALLFPTGSARGLARAVIETARDPAASARRAEAAKKRFLEDVPDEAAVARAHAELYRGLVGAVPVHRDG